MGDPSDREGLNYLPMSFPAPPKWPRSGGVGTSILSGRHARLPKNAYHGVRMSSEDTKRHWGHTSLRLLMLLARSAPPTTRGMSAADTNTASAEEVLDARLRPTISGN